MKAVVGDLTKFGAEVLVNAANGFGYMGGGVAGALRRAGGTGIETEAIEVCKELNPQPGQVYVTGAGRLYARYIYHAVTMKHPAERSTGDVVRRCLLSIVRQAREDGVASLAIPALGTGVGRVPKNEVAAVFFEVLHSVTDLDITVIDIDHDFIALLRELSGETNGYHQEYRWRRCRGKRAGLLRCSLGVFSERRKSRPMKIDRMVLVLDTNVVMGGLINQAKSSGRLMELWMKGEVEVVVSPDIKGEYLDIMSKMRFGPADAAKRRENALHQLLDGIHCRTVHPTVRLDLIPEDASDNKFLECAITGEATCVVTQDRHLLQLGEFQGIKILRASEFFQYIEEDGFLH